MKQRGEGGCSCWFTLWDGSLWERGEQKWRDISYTRACKWWQNMQFEWHAKELKGLSRIKKKMASFFQKPHICPHVVCGIATLPHLLQWSQDAWYNPWTVVAPFSEESSQSNLGNSFKKKKKDTGPVRYKRVRTGQITARFLHKEISCVMLHALEHVHFFCTLLEKNPQINLSCSD